MESQLSGRPLHPRHWSALGGERRLGHSSRTWGAHHGKKAVSTSCGVEWHGCVCVCVCVCLHVLSAASQRGPWRCRGTTAVHAIGLSSPVGPGEVWLGSSRL